MVADPLLPDAAGWTSVANQLPPDMERRVQRVFRPQNLLVQERLPEAYDPDGDETEFVQFQRYMATERAGENLTLVQSVYHIEISTTPLDGGNATVAVVPYQSNEHYDLITTKLDIDVQRKQNIVTAIQAVIDQHNANIVHVKAGTNLDAFSDTTGDEQIDYPPTISKAGTTLTRR